jgi:type I restriction enzyme S subunit
MGEVMAFDFPLPPRPEQQRIVGVLDEAFAAIETARANTEESLRNARGVFDSCLDRAFTEHDPGWVEKPLADCLRLITYGFTNPMPTTAEGPYMVTAKNVVGGRIDFASARRTSQDAFDRLLTDKSRPQVGDVLLTKDGTLGRVAVVDRAGICINQSVALLRPNERMMPQFMVHLLSSPNYQRRMVEAAGGTTIKHIYITRVDKMSVAFPDSHDEQKRIVSNLDSLNSEIQGLANVHEQKLAVLDELKQSPLHQAFTGAL